MRLRMNCKSSLDGQIFSDKEDRLGPDYQLIANYYKKEKKNTILLRPFSIHDARGKMGYFEDMTKEEITRRTRWKCKLLCS